MAWLSHVVPLGVPAAFLTAPRRQASSGPIDFIYIGTLATERRLESLLEAAAMVRRTEPCFSLTLAGPDGSSGHYARLARSMGLEALVRFTGALDTVDLAACIQRAHIGLAYIPLTRIYRHQPSLKALEFRALGIPMIGTATAHNRALIVDNVNGLLTGDSPQELADAMRKAMRPEWLAPSSERAEAMRAGTTWDEVARQYLETFLTPITP
jgi:glycosyltransferase involved in cell wall biosynthesis